MSKTAAWIMKVDETLYASVSQMELVHIIKHPECFHIPKAPDYCQNIIIWNDNILPVIDFSRLQIKVDTITTRDVVAVIIYKDSINAIQYGGIILSDSPELEYVDNAQLCELPEHYIDLKSISLSCFLSKAKHAVPILDMSKIFSKEFSVKYIRQCI